MAFWAIGLVAHGVINIHRVRSSEQRSGGLQMQQQTCFFRVATLAKPPDPRTKICWIRRQLVIPLRLRTY